jgi:hypothetical protein
MVERWRGEWDLVKVKKQKTKKRVGDVAQSGVLA